MAEKFAIGIILALGVGYLGFRKQALTRGGVIGAALIGGSIFAFGGWQAGVLLIVFFLSSSLLSFFRKNEKSKTAEKFEKGSRRDFWQTMANGGVATIAAIMAGIFPAPMWFAAFLGAIATVTADTWATELGVLSRETPRLITTGQPVPRGTSGGITIFGTLAAVAGAIFIGITAGVLGFGTSYGFSIVATGIIGGIVGALADSVLGATLQASYRCPRCGQETEQRFHHRCDNTPTRHIRGLIWMNNDAVNGISAFVGGAIAAIFTFF